MVSRHGPVLPHQRTLQQVTTRPDEPQEQVEAMDSLQPGANLTAHLPPSGQAESGPGKMAASFAAGVLAYLPQLLIWTLPSTSSYDRMQPNTWSGAFKCAERPSTAPFPHDNQSPKGRRPERPPATACSQTAGSGSISAPTACLIMHRSFFSTVSTAINPFLDDLLIFLISCVDGLPDTRLAQGVGRGQQGGASAPVHQRRAPDVQL